VARGVCACACLVRAPFAPYPDYATVQLYMGRIGWDLELWLRLLVPARTQSFLAATAALFFSPVLLVM